MVNFIGYLEMWKYPLEMYQDYWASAYFFKKVPFKEGGRDEKEKGRKGKEGKIQNS